MSNVSQVSGSLEPELVMELFDMPVTLHRSLIRITGSVAAALMLSRAIDESATLAEEAQGWFTKSQAQWSEDTGLSRWEQQTARRVLREAHLLDECRWGVPARLWFRVEQHHVWQALQTFSKSASDAVA